MSSVMGSKNQKAKGRASLRLSASLAARAPGGASLAGQEQCAAGAFRLVAAAAGQSPPRSSKQAANGAGNGELASTRPLIHVH